MIGTTLARYRITEKLGEGGMGSVWRAEDTVLGRLVALKLLTPHLARSDAASQRFIREARAASRLEHPGIAAVYDAGEAEGHVFIAYQLVEGATLTARLAAGPLPLSELFRLAKGTAEALAHAHGRGVLHRDLTAGNVMLRVDGSPVIVDFGLARTRGDATLTSTGTTLGTAPYLAPEQWRGEAGDARTDLWSLGVVLYYAATRQQPFGSEPPESVMYRVLNEEPAKPRKLRAELPAEFERLVLRLLEKDPRDRLASAAELAAGLSSVAGLEHEAPPASGETPLAHARRWWRRQARKRFGPAQATGVLLLGAAIVAGSLFVRSQLDLNREKVLAVLPMRVAGGDATESEVVAEALGEELAIRFRDAQSFRVLPWATTGRPLAPNVSLPQLARDIHANLLLTGSVTASEDDITARIEIVDAHHGEQVWSREFKRPAGDLIGLQTAIVSDVSLHLSPSLGEQARARLAAAAPSNPEAYEYFIRGSNYWHSGDSTLVPMAEQFFVRATELDSTLAGAWVALGALRTDRYFRGDRAGQAELHEAEGMFRRALRLRPEMPAAERGLIRVMYEREVSGRNLEFMAIAARALERDPNEVDQLTTAGLGFLLSSMAELSVPLFERALKLDPGNQGLAWYRVVALAWAGYPRRCIAAGSDYVRRFGEDLEIYTWMGVSEYALGMEREALLLETQASDLNSDALAHYSTRILALLAHEEGDTARADRALRARLPELEAQVAATPDNLRLQRLLVETYELLRDNVMYRAARDRARMVLNAPGFDVPMTSLARTGLLDDAKRVAASRAPPYDDHWDALIDSTGLAHRRAPVDVRTLYASPEYRRTQAAIDSTQVEAFNHYRSIVARALPNDPNVPGPRTTWPQHWPFQ